MKISIDVRMMWASGVGTYIRSLVPRILVSRPQDRFFLLGRPEEMERCEGFRPPQAQWVPAFSRIYSPAEQWELARLIPSDSGLFWSPFFNIPLFWRGRLMVTVHDVFHLAMGSMAGGIHKRLYARFMFRRLVRQAGMILAVSRFTRDELVHWTGTTAEKIQVIPNGVDESWFKVKRRLKPQTKPYLLFVGNIKPHKNLIRLLDAFGKLKSRIPHDLILVGKKDGFLTGDRAVLEKAQGMKDRVHFTGNVDEVLLGQYYAFADLLVFPSLYEGFGLPALEAMACGVPVAASKAASIPEVCGKAAVYFDPLDTEDMAEKILKLTVKGPFRQGMIQKGLRRAKGFNWDESAKKTNMVIDHLLNPKSKK